MTRDEAILLYTGKAKMISRIIDSKSLGCDKPEILNWWECKLTNHEELIEALKGPQPDAETGLMPCGCGGKAKEAKEETSIDEIGGDYISRVFCEECGIATEYYSDGNVAFLDWNRAMGWKA